MLKVGSRGGVKFEGKGHQGRAVS